MSIFADELVTTSQEDRIRITTILTTVLVRKGAMESDLKVSYHRSEFAERLEILRIEKKKET